jgi:hypothetical protein
LSTWSSGQGITSEALLLHNDNACLWIFWPLHMHFGSQEPRGTGEGLVGKMHHLMECSIAQAFQVCLPVFIWQYRAGIHQWGTQVEHRQQLLIWL